MAGLLRNTGIQRDKCGCRNLSALCPRWQADNQKQWGKLTDDDLDQIDGDRKKLAGRIREIYGIEDEAAEKQVKQWKKTTNISLENPKPLDPRPVLAARRT
jgi:uncharacterized protein YjbJ (UPF0337 family)